jgi:hypothetical protein
VTRKSAIATRTKILPSICQLATAPLGAILSGPGAEGADRLSCAAADDGSETIDASACSAGHRVMQLALDMYI